jgi:hypothetical protein
MTVLQVGRFARAIVSWQPREVIAFESTGHLTRVLEARAQSNPARFLSVEAFVPRGGRADYGAIGVDYAPAWSERLRVIVGYGDPRGESWPNALASTIDQVRVGLPEEYSQAVLDGLLAGLRSPPASGSLRVVEAAHGRIGSSPAFFRVLAGAVAELLHQVEMAEADVVELLEDRLVKMSLVAPGK